MADPGQRPPPGRKIIRPVPVQGRGPTRLPGLEALSHEGDMNWRRGIAVLWAFLGLIAGAELSIRVFGLFLGDPVGFRISDLVRLVLLCAVFLALWFGRGWTRWVLAAFAFLYGARSLAVALWINDLTQGPQVEIFAGHTRVSRSFLTTPGLVAGALYLALSGYLAFSGDVLGFIKHRREQGRRWVIVPVSLGLGFFLVAYFISPLLFDLWAAGQRRAAVRFDRQTIRALTQSWDPQAVAARSDAHLLETWPAASRNDTLAMLRPLGPQRGTEQETVDTHILFDGEESAFVVRSFYHLSALCAHGRAEFELTASRGLFGPWRLHNFSVGNMVFDSPAAVPPPATPAASPVPSTGG